MLLAMGTWGWIGVVAGSWCLFSFVAALLLGRAIRMSERSGQAAHAQQLPIQKHPEYSGGFAVLDRQAMGELGRLGHEPRATGTDG